MKLYISDYHAELIKGSWSVVDNDGNIFGRCKDEKSARVTAIRFNQEGGKDFTDLLEKRIESFSRRFA